MPQPLNAVIAGSKSFVDAVQPQLQLRLGAAPEVATDPAAALQSCAQRGGLLVFEHGAAEWAAALRSLRGRAGPGAVTVIAAVADLASAAQPMDGVDEVVPWQGRPDPVMWAVERVVTRAARAAAPPPLPPAAAPERAPAVAPAVDIYALGGTDASGAPASGDPVGMDASAWPNAVPALAEAELLLARAVAGELPPGDAGARMAGVVATLSRLEHGALAGTLTEVEPAALVEAAAQRLRVAEALGTVPATAAAVDPVAAERLLSDLDVVLGRVKALAAAVQPEVGAELEVVRGALVSAGIDLSGVVSALGAAAEVPPTAVTARRLEARVLSNDGEDAWRDGSQRTRLRALAVLLALAIGGAGAFHGWLAYTRPAAVHPTLPGAPRNTFGAARGAAKVLSAMPGRTIDPAEFGRFKAAEEAKGNEVRQVAPGRWIITQRPVAAPAAGGTP
jgi:hypothetical protein